MERESEAEMVRRLSAEMLFFRIRFRFPNSAIKVEGRRDVSQDRVRLERRHGQNIITIDPFLSCLPK